MEAQQLGHALKLGPEIKDGSSSAKNGVPEGFDRLIRDNPERGKLDPARILLQVNPAS